MAALVQRARAAQRIADGYDQARVDELVAAAGWAIIEPARNRELAELAVADTGIGDVDDKVRKNHRKTLGLLRDLQGAKSVGVIAEDPATGIIEIARPVGVVCAITPTTNPAATPANKIINALKGRNAVIVAPSPKGWSTCARLIEFIHAQFDRIGAPRDLVQLLPAPVNKASTAELMRQCDLVVATGSQANVRAAYASGTPAFGVGAGNVAVIVDETADVAPRGRSHRRVEDLRPRHQLLVGEPLVLVGAVREPMLAALRARGAVLLDAAQKASAAGADVARRQAVVGGDRPVGGEDRAPAPASTPSPTRSRACCWSTKQRLRAGASVLRREAQPGAGAVHGARFRRRAGASSSASTPSRAPAIRWACTAPSPSMRCSSACTLPVSRVIVNQAHCIATGGSFDNGLPFSLSMGCGTWGRNNFSDNMNYRHYLNITRVSRPIAEEVPSEEQIFGAYFARHGRHEHPRRCRAR